MKLPEWSACMRKRYSGEEMSLLERFIWDNEPPNIAMKARFRNQLVRLLEDARDGRILGYGLEAEHGDDRHVG